MSTAAHLAAERGIRMTHPDPWALNVDLHCHSVVSDGTQQPRDIVRRAAANGVQLLSLTDHDELRGLDDAVDEAAALGLNFVPGVEISVTWGGETIHIVGLRIDRRDPALVDGLRRTREGRDSRAHEMAAALDAVGIHGAYEGAMRYVANPDLISRNHFARFMVEQGVCASTNEVFRRYLTPGNPGYVPHRWASLPEAVGWIRGAGGTAVIAHPGRYRLSDTQLWAMAEEFRDLGGEGIEVQSASHDAAAVERFAQWCQRLGMRASRASDFHDPRESRFDLGSLPALPGSVVPVWADWPEIASLSSSAH